MIDAKQTSSDVLQSMSQNVKQNAVRWAITHLVHQIITIQQAKFEENKIPRFGDIVLGTSQNEHFDNILGVACSALFWWKILILSSKHTYTRYIQNRKHCKPPCCQRKTVQLIKNPNEMSNDRVIRAEYRGGRRSVSFVCVREISGFECPLLWKA